MDALVAEVTYLMDELVGCCLKAEKVPTVASVVSYWKMPAADRAYADTDSVWLFTDGGGRFWVFSEWGDTTGHGCQCGSSLCGPFATLPEAYWLGCGEGERGKLGLNIQKPAEV